MLCDSDVSEPELPADAQGRAFRPVKNVTPIPFCVLFFMESSVQVGFLFPDALQCPNLELQLINSELKLGGLKRLTADMVTMHLNTQVLKLQSSLALPGLSFNIYLF